jgi:hypothetical protein
MKVDLRPFHGENKVVTFTKTRGETADEHFIVRKINEERLKNKDGQESTYHFWSFGGSLESDDPYLKKRKTGTSVGDGGSSGSAGEEDQGCSSGSAAAAGPAFTPPPAPPVDDGAAAGSALSAASAADGGRASPPLARILGYEVVDPNSPEIIRAKDEVIKSKDEAIAKCEELIRAKDEVITAKQFAIDALLRVLNRN